LKITIGSTSKEIGKAYNIQDDSLKEDGFLKNYGYNTNYRKNRKLYK